MLVFDPRQRRSPTRAFAAAALLVLAGALLFASGGQVLHVNDVDTPSYFNEQHVLASLAALAADAPLPEAPAVGTLVPLSPALLLAAIAPVTVRVARHADPRAPPTV
jgi:hypothetical protein